MKPARRILRFAIIIAAGISTILIAGHVAAQSTSTVATPGMTETILNADCKDDDLTAGTA